MRTYKIQTLFSLHEIAVPLHQRLSAGGNEPLPQDSVRNHRGGYALYRVDPTLSPEASLTVA